VVWISEATRYGGTLLISRIVDSMTNARRVFMQQGCSGLTGLLEKTRQSECFAKSVSGFEECLLFSYVMRCL
jgi:hypothetical protein